jgi:hypothetical protein
MDGQVSVLTPEIRALIGLKGERVEAGLWGIERDDLRRFTQAIMDPDPRYWDEEFARTTRFGRVITPPIYCTYLARKTPNGVADPVSAAFAQNPDSDGSGSAQESSKGGLPPIPTNLRRVLNGGNEIEVFKYPGLGDRVFSQVTYADIVERRSSDGSPMLIVTNEILYSDQDGDLLCIMRSSVIRR